MVALYLNKIEYPSPKDALCQVWLNFIQWFLRRRFLKFVNVILLFRCYLPLCFVPSFVENGPLVLEKKKIWRVYDDYDDNRQPLAQVS